MTAATTYERGVKDGHQHFEMFETLAALTIPAFEARYPHLRQYAAGLVAFMVGVSLKEG